MNWKPWSAMLGAIAMMAMVGCDAALEMENGSALPTVEEGTGINDETLERQDPVPGTVPDVVQEEEPAPETEPEVIPDGRTPPNAVEGANGTPQETTN